MHTASLYLIQQRKRITTGPQLIRSVRSYMWGMIRVYQVQQHHSIFLLDWEQTTNQQWKCGHDDVCKTVKPQKICFSLSVRPVYTACKTPDNGADLIQSYQYATTPGSVLCSEWSSINPIWSIVVLRCSFTINELINCAWQMCYSLELYICKSNSVYIYTCLHTHATF